MEDYRYWYGSAFRGGNSGANVPPQAIPLTKKNKKWREACMDSFEAIGNKQLTDNFKFADIFRMIEGKMSYTELSEVMPQYRELEEVLNGVEIDTWIRHYDIIGIIINALAGERAMNSDKFSISTIDEISTNEYIRTKTDKLLEYISVEFDKELQLRLISIGINPDIPDEAFQDPQQLEEYKTMIANKRAEMTPSQIERYMQTNWKTVAAKWAALKYQEDTINHNLDDLDNENFIHYLSTGRCFRHYRVAYDYYDIENWHPLNTFFSQDVDNRFVQHGDYVGRIHKFSRSQIINKFGHKLTTSEQKKIMKSDWNPSSTGTTEDKFFDQGSNVSYKKMFESHFHNLQTVAFDGESDYKLALDIQDSLGIPMGEKMIVGRDGEYEKVPVLLPGINDVTGNLGYTSHNGLFSAMRSDITLRDDLLTVTEVYWRSYKRVGYLRYQTPDGEKSSAIVSEELLDEFLKYNEIKNVTNIALENIEEEQEDNTIVWVYQPEVWKGIKIKDSDEDYYIDIAPCEFQIKGNGNIFDVLLPVSGYTDSSLAQKIEPYQVMYNVVMNQIFNLLEKEIGLFFIFDVNFLPSEFKEWGDSTEDTLLYMRDIAKDIGFVPVDSSKQNLVGGANFNQFSAQNLSFSTQISDRMQLAEFIKNKAFEQVGITPQRLGAPSKYENAEGIKISQDASYAQTEQYFSKFSNYIKNSLELHLCVAQYCQKDGKDLQLFFTQNDATQAFINESDENFSFRRFSVVPISNSKKREQLKTFKTWLVQTNTLGTDELAMAELITSDSMTEIIEAARSARIQRQQQEQQVQEIQGQQAQQLEQMKAQAEEQAWQREEVSHDKDINKDIKVATINAFGRAADKDADMSNFDIIEKQSNISLKQSKLQADNTNKRVEQDIKRQKLSDDRQKDMNNMKIKLAELATRRSISQDNKYIAKVNKN